MVHRHEKEPRGVAALGDDVAARYWLGTGTSTFVDAFRDKTTRNVALEKEIAAQLALKQLELENLDQPTREIVVAVARRAALLSAAVSGAMGGAFPWSSYRDLFTPEDVRNVIDNNGLLNLPVEREGFDG